MKIEIIEQMSQSEEDRTLDIFQLKIIDMWETLLSEKNIMDYLISLANEKGYCLWTEEKDNKIKFIGCKKEHLGFNGNKNIHEQFEWNLILVVKNYYINVFGDFIIEAWLDPKTTIEINDFYLNKKVLSKEVKEELKNIVSKKGRNKLVISRNSRKASKTRSMFKKYFVFNKSH